MHLVSHVHCGRDTTHTRLRALLGNASRKLYGDEIGNIGHEPSQEQHEQDQKNSPSAFRHHERS
jgi:hypothetical protein